MNELATRDTSHMKQVRSARAPLIVTLKVGLLPLHAVEDAAPVLVPKRAGRGKWLPFRAHPFEESLPVRYRQVSHAPSPCSSPRRMQTALDTDADLDGVGQRPTVAAMVHDPRANDA